MYIKNHCSCLLCVCVCVYVCVCVRVCVSFVHAWLVVCNFVCVINNAIKPLLVFTEVKVDSCIHVAVANQSAPTTLSTVSVCIYVDGLVCSTVGYFYESRCILASP